MIMNDKLCKNCKHFYEHYVINVRGYLVNTNGGHCGQPYNYNKYIRGNKEACKHWEADEEKIEKRTQYIKNTLMQMAKRIEDIALILKND